jgi:MazG family protein
MLRDALVSEMVALYELTGRLRKECPWDRKQTQESIVAYTVEETYELADAIAERQRLGDADVRVELRDADVRVGPRDRAIRGELGDLLYQVFFMACVAEEQGLYDLGDVAAGISAKLVRRHPHIFGEAKADTPEEVRETWEAIKRGSEGREGIFHDIPNAFPSTLLAQKLQQRAAAVGFDWRHAQEVMAKVREETGEVEQELAGEATKEVLLDEVGDLLFAVVNLARKLTVDPELALRRSALRFRARVEGAAGLAAAEGLEFESLALDEQEAYYQRAKKEQRR